MSWRNGNPEVEFSVLLGKTLTAVEGKVGGDVIRFTASDGSQYELFHEQDCCEHVYVQDIVGDLVDLVGAPILQAEEVSNQDDPPGYQGSEWRDSYTWTFYKLATIKGYVTIRFLGESNGYYSESVSFEQVTAPSTPEVNVGKTTTDAETFRQFRAIIDARYAGVAPETITRALAVMDAILCSGEFCGCEYWDGKAY